MAQGNGNQPNQQKPKGWFLNPLSANLAFWQVPSKEDCMTDVISVCDFK